MDGFIQLPISEGQHQITQLENTILFGSDSCFDSKISMKASENKNVMKSFKF